MWSPLFLGLLAVGQAASQHFELSIGNTDIIDLQRDLNRARQSGDMKLASQLSQKLETARSSVFMEDESWTTECKVSASIEAEIYAVQDPAHAPKEIEWAMERLDKIWTKDDGSEMPYPGDFKQFMHPDGFRFMRVAYDDLPAAVREWHEDALQAGDELDAKAIAVLDGSAFFAPGIVTYLLPLFATREVAKGNNACEDELLKLKNFHDKKGIQEDVKFMLGYNSIMQVGNSITVEAFVKKEVRGHKKEAKPEKERISGNHEANSEL